MVGYQFNGSKDLAGPRNDRLDLKNAALRGISIGYLGKEDTENGQLELSWTRANSSSEVLLSEGAPSDRFDVRIDRFHLNGLYMLEPAPVQPFFLFGLGATRFNPTGARSTTTLFSFALGGGVKWLWNDYLGLRFDGRWTPALAPRGTHFFCDETANDTCYSTESNSYFSRAYPLLNAFEFTTGLLLRY
jgi:hypothetical protein